MEIPVSKEQKLQQRMALWIAAVGSFSTPFMASSISIALPTIGKEFGMGAVAIGWIATSFQLAASALLLPLGKLADIKGRKLIYTIGMTLYLVSSLMCGFAFSAWFLILSRVLQGISASMVFSTAVAILTSVYPKEKRGRALGFIISITYVGLSFGPVAGGFLTEYFGWRSIFYVFIPFSIAVLIMLNFLKGEWAEAKDEKLDISISLLYIVSLSAIIYGLSRLPHQVGFILFFAGILLLTGFLILQGKIKFPLLNTFLFRTNRVFAYSTIAALINYSATFGVTFLLSLYLQYVKMMTPKEAGMILVFQPVTMALFSPLAGRLSDKIESGKIASAGMAITVIGLVILSFFNAHTAISTIIISLLLLGFGFALFSSPNTNSVMSSVEKKFYGVASATVSTMRMVGQMFSMGIAMLLINIFIGTAKITISNSGNYLKVMQSAFLIFSFLCIIGVFASMARMKNVNHSS